MLITPRQNIWLDYPQQLESIGRTNANASSRSKLIEIFEIGYLCGMYQQIDLQTASTQISQLSDYFNNELITLKERSILFLALLDDPALNLEKTIYSKFQSVDQDLSYIILKPDYKDPAPNGFIQEPIYLSKAQKYQNGFHSVMSIEEEKMTQEQIDKLLAEDIAAEIEAETRARAQEPETNCEICLESLSSKEFIAFDQCPHVYHRECIHEFVQEAVKSKRSEIKCPNLNCTANLTTKDIEEIIDGEALDNYLQNQLDLYISANQKDISYCPTPGCNYAFIHDGQPEFSCLKCSSHYCLDCRVQYHVGQSCLDYKRDKVNNTFGEADEQFMNFVKGANFKQCERCKFWVEKNKGCNHMTCRCRHQFCYVCGLKWKTCGCR